MPFVRNHEQCAAARSEDRFRPCARQCIVSIPFRTPRGRRGVHRRPPSQERLHGAFGNRRPGFRGFRSYRIATSVGEGGPLLVCLVEPWPLKQVDVVDDDAALHVGDLAAVTGDRRGDSAASGEIDARACVQRRRLVRPVLGPRRSTGHRCAAEGRRTRDRGVPNAPAERCPGGRFRPCRGPRERPGHPAPVATPGVAYSLPAT